MSRSTTLKTLLVAVIGGLAAMFAVSAPAGAHVYQPMAKLSQAQAASQLSAAGITWSSSGGCTDRSNSHCTSFDQVNQATVSGIITLRNASGCGINITGGTEVGHADGTYSHYNGYKLDVAHNSCLDGYVHGTFGQIGNRGDGYPQWQSGSGNIYCDEGSHWDITFYNCGGC
ncbi:MAG: hypothetical protein WCA46_28575 [Actinocatenispora sp.]